MQGAQLVYPHLTTFNGAQQMGQPLAGQYPAYPAPAQMMVSAQWQSSLDGPQNPADHHQYGNSHQIAAQQSMYQQQAHYPAMNQIQQQHQNQFMLHPVVPVSFQHQPQMHTVTQPVPTLYQQTQLGPMLNHVSVAEMGPAQHQPMSMPPLSHQQQSLMYIPYQQMVAAPIQGNMVPAQMVPVPYLQHTQNPSQMHVAAQNPSQYYPTNDHQMSAGSYGQPHLHQHHHQHQQQQQQQHQLAPHPHHNQLVPETRHPRLVQPQMVAAPLMGLMLRRPIPPLMATAPLAHMQPNAFPMSTTMGLRPCGPPPPAPMTYAMQHAPTTEEFLPPPGGFSFLEDDVETAIAISSEPLNHSHSDSSLDEEVINLLPSLPASPSHSPLRFTSKEADVSVPAPSSSPALFSPARPSSAHPKCRRALFPTTTPPASDSESSNKRMAEKRRLDDEQLQKCFYPSFLRRFRPAEVRDCNIADDEDVHSQRFAALTLLPLGKSY